MNCLHKVAQGFGGMGDGYVCVKCGWEVYYRPLISTVLPERTDEMHFNEFPFIRRFPERVSHSTDPYSWTEFWGKDGKLHPRSEL